MELDRHSCKPDRLSLRDFAKVTYKEELEGAGKRPIEALTEVDLEMQNFQSDHPLQPMGFALPRPTSGVTFTREQ